MVNVENKRFRNSPAPRDLLGRAWRTNRPLTFAGLAMLLTFGATIVGLIIDPRVITGAPA